MLTSIYLENWKTHKNTKLNFKQGTNTFIGKVGSGKSSIIEGVCYCLYGDFPNRANRKINLLEAIMFKPVKKETAKLILELEKENNHYRIEREIQKNKINTAKLYKNNQLIAGPKQKEVTQKVSEILGLDYSLFVTIVYSEQNELDYFLKIPPNKRKEKFDELFGISELSFIKDNANEISKELIKDQNTQEAILKQIVSQLSSIDINKLKKEQLEEQQKIQKLLEEKEKQSFQKTTLFETLKQLKEKKQKHEHYGAEINICEFKIEEIKKDLKKLEEKHNDYFLKKAQELLEEKQNIQTKKNKLKELLEEKQKLSLKINSFNKNIEYIEKQIQEKETQETPKEISEKIEVLEKEISLQTKQLEQKQEENKKKELEQKNLENTHKFYVSEKEKQDQKITLLEQKKHKITLAETQLKKELELLKEEHKQQQEKQINLKTQNKDLEKAINALEKDIFKCPVCDSSLSQEERRKKLEEKQEKLALNIKELEQTNDLLKEILEKQKKTEIQEKNLEENKLLEKQIQEHDEQKQIYLEKINHLEKELLKKTPIIDIKQEKQKLEDAKKNLDVFYKQKQTYENILKLKKDLKQIFSEKKDLEKMFEDIKITDKDLEEIEQIEKQITLAEEHLYKKKEQQEYLEKYNLYKHEKEKINYKEEEYLKISSEERNLENNLKNLEEKTNLFSKNIKDRQERIDHYNKQKEEEQIKKQVYDKILLRKKSVSDFMVSIEHTKEQLRKEIISEINQALDIIWPKVYPYKDYLSARLSSKNDYILEVLTTEKEWLRVEGFLSGGERACAALSIRIAIALILTKSLGLLILDEPTHNLDVETITALSQVLDNQLPSLVDQIFVITHDQKLLDITTSKKFLLDRDKEIDGVSSVVEY